MKTEIKFQTIGTRAVVSKKITPEQAAVIRKNSEKYAASVRKALAHDLDKALLLIQ